MPILTGVRNAILADNQIAQRFAQWDMGSGLTPALFTTRNVPDELPAKYGILELMGGVNNNDTRNTHTADYLVFFSVYGDRQHSDYAISRIARLVKQRLHGHPERVTIEGYSCSAIEADPPRRASGPNEIEGQEVDITLTLTEV